mgnify:CR=1 FL=1
MYIMSLRDQQHTKGKVRIWAGASASKLKKHALILFGRLPQEWVIFNRHGQIEDSGYQGWDARQVDLRDKPRQADLIVW